ncbi:MAG: RecX family transcriptional regulator [Alphaproteobacteria bacterium]|nr:RecX family transcriptional regulator [Alphaproteobacteria bacterium]MCB9928858.1 RecX family transcriptional regulator [Alphaproteobacteria bacterium]
MPPAPKLDLVPAALAYLAKYAASTAHLRQVLRRKAERRVAQWDTPPAEAVMTEAVETALARATALGLLNDPDYAAAHARQHRRRGESLARIRARLMAKGLEPADIAAALAQFDADETAAATRFAQRKRLGPYRLRPGKPDQRQRDIAALCRAGFPLRVAHAVIDEG